MAQTSFNFIFSPVCASMRLMAFKRLFAVGKMNCRQYSIGPTSFEEWKISVPWGQISGKWWGNRKKVPVLAIHEYRQNASAFDNLIPKLNVPSVLAIDLPGHGNSSQFPKGHNITQMEYLIALRYVTLKLPPGQLSIIGHGLGSFLSFIFSASFFKIVESLISIECSRHTITHITTCKPNSWGHVQDRFFEIENSTPGSYTKEELLQMIKNTGRMSNEAANILLQRASEPSAENDSRLLFKNDPRFEIYMFCILTDPDILAIADNMACKFVEIRNKANDKLIKYKPGEVSGTGAFALNLPELIQRKGPDGIKKLHQQSWERLREACRHFFIHEVDSPQHILLDDSETTAKLINGFYNADLEEHRIIYPNNK